MIQARSFTVDRENPSWAGMEWIKNDHDWIKIFSMCIQQPVPYYTQ